MSRRNGRPVWMGETSVITRIAKALAIVVVVALVVFPFVVVVATSLADPQEVVANGGWVVWPDRFTLDSYREVLAGGIVGRAMLISGAYTIIGTGLSLACTIGLAFGLARPQVFGGKPILLAVMFTFLFPPGMIPLFLVVQNTGLFDSYAAMVLPFLVNVFNLVVMRGFFQSIPGELIEAARIDGAGELRILTKVVLPLSKSVVAVVGLFYAVAYWNRFFEASIYLNDSTKWPIAQVLRLYVTGGAQMADVNVAESGIASAPQSVQMAIVIIAVTPIICIYPFLQRFFVRGVLTGAVKA